MDVRQHLRAALAAALGAVGVDVPETIGLERPARREHGDWSSNIALATAKAAGRTPRDLAQALADHLNGAPPAHVTAVEIAGPGFLNFRLADTWLLDVLRDVVTHGQPGYATHAFGDGTRVNLEFVSANPTGPLHAGHGRWAAFGDSLARVLERCGYKVHREFYVNDRGVQIQQFGASLAARKRGEEPPEDGYIGTYVTEWAAEMPDGVDPAEWGIARALQDQREVLAAMHVEFDTWRSERDLVGSGAMDRALTTLRERGFVDEREGAVWLRTTDFGDEKDRVLVKSDGEPTYFLPDIAYHDDKFDRGDLLIDILGADHHGYAPRMRAAVQMLGHPADSYEALIGQNVTLLRGGQEVRLSKRAGTMIETRDLIDEIGPDAARLVYLLQSIDTRQSIDLDVVTAQSAENPVFYVQYAHARIASIGRKATEVGIARQPLDLVDLGLLREERELELLRVLFELPDVVRISTIDRAPHRIATWARELAAAFHGFYHDHYVIHPDVAAELSQARLWLVEAVRTGLAISLDLLGVSAPESM